ncbi:MAG TPA: hypothetical protein VF169_04895 [Albitalea sp.]
MKNPLLRRCLAMLAAAFVAAGATAAPRILVVTTSAERIGRD